MAKTRWPPIRGVALKRNFTVDYSFPQNVKLTFTASDDITLSRPQTTYKVSEEEKGKCYRVAIHDIYSEEERCILAAAKLTACPTMVDPTSFTVVTCKVEYFDVLSSKQSEGTSLVNVVRNRSLQHPIPSDAQDEVELHRMRCEVASTLEEAGKLANAGNIPAARKVLVHMQQRVQDSKVAARPLAVHLQGTMKHSLDGLEDTVCKIGDTLIKKNPSQTIKNHLPCC